MKVMHVIDSAGLYGAEMVLLNLASEQVRLGLEPVIASIGAVGNKEKPLETEARRRELRVETFRMRPGPNLLGVREMLRFVREERVDLIHSHGYKGNVFFGLLPRWLLKVPVVSTVHGWTWDGGLNRMMLYEWLDAQALRFVDAVVLVSGSMREHPRLKGRKELPLQVVPNGVAIPASGAGRPPLDDTVVAFCGSAFTIGTIGRLSPEKGFDLLLEALSLLVSEGRDARLVVLGEGSERGRLERKVRALGLEKRVLMPGYLSPAWGYLPLFGALAISSHTEGLPMVLLEALSVGVPVVSTRVGGIPEVLQEGRGGVLVPPGNAAELARGIGCVISDEVAARSRSELGREVVRTAYSVSAMASAYSRIYGMVAAGNSETTIDRVRGCE